jgi:alcohol dehydrogenase class IV
MRIPGVSSYEFLAPRRIVFGWGRFDAVGEEARRLGKRAFLIIGSRTLEAEGVVARLRERLTATGVEAVELASISHEPDVSDVDRTAGCLRQHGPGAEDLVIGLGGGSAIDLAKAAAALATQTAGSSVRDYLEGVGRGLTLSVRPLTVLAVPTTAGTGSEATKNAVISSDHPPFKKSLRCDAMMPHTVLVDPQLSVTVGPRITAETGMDAVTQLIESYLSRKARPISDALALAGLPLALPAIVEAVENGTSRVAREAMAQAALLSGMALANSGLGMAHGVAAALGSNHRVSHGLACAVMLPVALRANLDVSRDRLAVLARVAGLAEGATPRAAAEALLARIDEINRRIGIPQRLSQLGVKAADLPALARDSRGNSMDGNPRCFTEDELLTLLEGQL